MMHHLEIPMTKDLEEFFIHKYHNKANKLVDDFLLYLNTQKEAQDLNKALSEVKEKKTNNIEKLFDAL